MCALVEQNSLPPESCLSDCRDIVNGALPFLIPVPNAYYVNTFPSVFCLGGSACGDSIVYFLNHKLTSTSETGVVSLDSAWLLLIKESIRGAIIHQNQHDESSQVSLRPDAVVEYCNALVLKVESKADENNLLDAHKELIDKFGDKSIDCFPRRRNSIFGIATTATIISLLSLYFDEGKYSKYILKQYDMTSMLSRVQFIQDIFKIIRWIRTVTGPNRDFHLMQNVKVKTRNGHTICWDGNCLTKTFKTHNSDRLRRIETVYSRKLPNVEWGELPARSRKTITITRIGKQLLTALRERLVTKEQIRTQLQEAIAQLHTIGLAHCDICLENAFYDESTNSVFLDDLEYLTPVEDPPPHYTRISMDRPRPATASELDILQLDELTALLNRL
jgi:hypothetical protein